MYDRISLRVHPGYKAKFEALASAAGLSTEKTKGITAYFEWLIDEAERKSTRAKKKDQSQG